MNYSASASSTRTDNGLPELEESERIILEVLNEQKDVSVKTQY
jgi:hypothetical protein